MNLTELTTFLAVVEAKSLVRAAQRLNVTQSTVTARIDSLEERLGQRLLHRLKSGTELTSAGFKLVRYAEAVDQLWRQARQEIGLPQGFTGVCNVGCYFDLWEGMGQRFVEAVRHHRPDVAVAIWPGDQRNLDRWLESGLIDLAFCYTPQARGALAVRELTTDRFVRVVFDPPPGGPPTAEIYVDYGEPLRREHAVAYAGTAPAALTLASARWAIDHLTRWGGAGYLPERHLGLAATGNGRVDRDAPVLSQQVWLVENTAVTRHWDWLDEAIAAVA